MPRVILANLGLGWGWEAARAAVAVGYLQRYIAGVKDPAQTGIPPEIIRYIRLPNYLGWALGQIPTAGSIYFSYLLRDNAFDLASRTLIEPTDIFHGFNHMSLYSLRKARRLGARTAIDRASAHAAAQERLLREEFTRLGADYPHSAALLVRKHVQEYEEADAIFVASEFIRRSMLEEGVPAQKLKLLPLGFDPGKFKPGPKPDELFRVLFVGMIGVRKGLHLLLEAWKRLQLPNAELLLVGGLSSDARIFIDLYRGLYRQVDFVRQEQLADLYRSASVFVLPSIEEGFGMVVAEAAASGLPVIISENVGATIRDGVDGYITPLRDIDALCDRLLVLYRDPDLRARMGASAHDYIQQYTWERYHRGLIAHYDEMLS